MKSMNHYWQVKGGISQCKIDLCSLIGSLKSLGWQYLSTM